MQENLRVRFKRVWENEAIVKILCTPCERINGLK